MTAKKSRWRVLAPWLWCVVCGVAAIAVVLFGVERVYEVPLRPESFRFERPWVVWFLPAAWVAVAGRLWLQERSRRSWHFSRVATLAPLAGGLRPTLRQGLIGLRFAALLLLIVGAMGPQSIHARQQTEVEGIDILLVLDLSLSMQAADIAPNRFTATQHVVDAFIVRRPNDRIGAVIFGREAYTLLPLTTDTQALRTMIDELQLGVIDGRGTAIGNALGVALNRLRHSKAKSRVVILLTDGDSNSGNISPTEAAELATTMGAKVYTILMGQSDQAQVQRGVDLFGRPLWDRGNFPVNPQLLSQMAKRTGGEAFQAADRRQLEQSFHAILNRLEKTKIADLGKVFGELYPACLWPALLLLLLEQALALTWLRRWP